MVRAAVPLAPVGAEQLSSPPERWRAGRDTSLYLKLRAPLQSGWSRDAFASHQKPTVDYHFHCEERKMAIVGNAKMRLKARYVDAFKMDKGSRASGYGPALTNADLEPVHPKNRNWNWKTYASYWLSESWGATAMSVGSAMVASGLLWWQAIIGCTLAHVIGAILTVFNCVSAVPNAECTEADGMLINPHRDPVPLITSRSPSSSERPLASTARIGQYFPDPCSISSGMASKPRSAGLSWTSRSCASSEMRGRIFRTIFPHQPVSPPGA